MCQGKIDGFLDFPPEAFATDQRWWRQMTVGADDDFPRMQDFENVIARDP